jgi:hypothetical protein
MILGIFFLIILLICIPALLRKPKEEAEEEKRLKESLQDETIYVPEMGTRLTIEEAEKGHFIVHDNKLRRKAEAELDQNYSWEQAQVEKIRNYVIEADYAFPTDEVEDKLIEALGNCSFTGRYSDIRIYFTVQINEVLFLLILLVDYQISTEKYHSSEWHIAAAKHRGSINAGHDSAELQNKEMDKGLGALGAEYTLEPTGEYLILKLYRHATLDDAQQVIRILKNATANIKQTDK